VFTEWYVACVWLKCVYSLTKCDKHSASPVIDLQIRPRIFAYRGSTAAEVVDNLATLALKLAEHSEITADSVLKAIGLCVSALIQLVTGKQ